MRRIRMKDDIDEAGLNRVERLRCKKMNQIRCGRCWMKFGKAEMR